MTKTDDELKRAIDAELAADPKVNSAQIGVTVDEGAVSLLGTVDTCAEKCAAEAATRRVGGVRTVTPHLTVRVQGDTTEAYVKPAITETQVIDQNETMN